MDKKQFEEDRDDAVGVGRARISNKLGSTAVDWRSTPPTYIQWWVFVCLLV